MVIYCLQPQFVNKLLPFIEVSCSSLHTVGDEESCGEYVQTKSEFSELSEIIPGSTC